MKTLNLVDLFNQYVTDQKYVIQDNCVIRGERYFFIVILKENQKIEYTKLGLKHSMDLVVISSKRQSIRNNGYWIISESIKENFFLYMLIRKRDISGNPISPKGDLKCIHCKKLIGEHKAKTFNCPLGRRTSIGYTQYYQNKIYTKKEKR